MSISNEQSLTELGYTGQNIVQSTDEVVPQTMLDNLVGEAASLSLSVYITCMNRRHANGSTAMTAC